MGSLTNEKRDLNGVGVLRVHQHIPNGTETLCIIVKLNLSLRSTKSLHVDKPSILNQ